MHEILEEFCDKWVWPTMPGAPGAEFRLKLTREQCVKGWVKDERELMDIAQANVQPLPAYFGLSMMFPHIHPLARAAQNYYTEANACLGIMAYLKMVDDPLVRHEHLSQRDEELMHFM